MSNIGIQRTIQNHLYLVAKLTTKVTFLESDITSRFFTHVLLRFLHFVKKSLNFQFQESILTRVKVSKKNVFLVFHGFAHFQSYQ